MREEQEIFYTKRQEEKKSRCNQSILARQQFSKQNIFNQIPTYSLMNMYVFVRIKGIKVDIFTVATKCYFYFYFKH